MVVRINCVAVDDSLTSEHAFNWYLSNYHRDDDKLLLAYVQALPRIPTPYTGILSGKFAITKESQTIIDESIARSHLLLSKYRNICDKKNINYQLVARDLYHSCGYTLCEIAKDNKVDIIILGQRGIGAISRVFKGSTSDYVLHHANCPVLVIPPPSNIGKNDTQL